LTVTTPTSSPPTCSATRALDGGSTSAESIETVNAAVFPTLWPTEIDGAETRMPGDGTRSIVVAEAAATLRVTVVLAEVRVVRSTTPPVAKAFDTVSGAASPCAVRPRWSALEL
jgi:hypothetical protein